MASIDLVNSWHGTDEAIRIRRLLRESRREKCPVCGKRLVSGLPRLLATPSDRGGKEQLEVVYGHGNGKECRMTVEEALTMNAERMQK